MYQEQPQCSSVVGKSQLLSDKKVGEIPQRLEAIDQVLNALHCKIDDIAQALDPVLSGETPMCASEQKQTPPETRLGSSLASIESGLLSATLRIEYLLDRLEV